MHAARRPRPPRTRRDGVVDLGAAVERRLRHLEALPAHGVEVAGGVEGVDLDVLVPHEDVVVLLHHVRVQEALGEPPLGLPRRRHVHGAGRPLEVAPLLHRAVVVEEHHGEVAGGELGDQLVDDGLVLDSHGDRQEALGLGLCRHRRRGRRCFPLLLLLPVLGVPGQRGLHLQVGRVVGDASRERRPALARTVDLPAGRFRRLLNGLGEKHLARNPPHRRSAILYKDATPYWRRVLPEVKRGDTAGDDQEQRDADDRRSRADPAQGQALGVGRECGAHGCSFAGNGTKGMIGRESREVTSSAVLCCGMAGSFL